MAGLLGYGAGHPRYLSASPTPLSARDATPIAADPVPSQPESAADLAEESVGGYLARRGAPGAGARWER